MKPNTGGEAPNIKNRKKHLGSTSLPASTLSSTLNTDLSLKDYMTGQDQLLNKKANSTKEAAQNDSASGIFSLQSLTNKVDV
jgi:hypothetical protein